MSFLLSLGGLAAANLFLVFLIQGYILITIGPGIETDALFAGMAIPQLILSVMSGSLMHVMVPLLAGENEEQLRKDSWGFFILTGGIFSAFAVFLYMFAPFWVLLVFPGFSDVGKTLTIELTRIQLIGMVFTALSAVLWAVYHARQRFLWVEFTNLLELVLGFGFLVWLLPKFGIQVVAWVGVVRGILRTMFLLPGLGNYCKPDWGSTALEETWRRIKPLLLGTAYFKMNPLVDRFLSSLTPAGGLSLLCFGQQMYGAANEMISKAVVVPMVPLLAVHTKASNWSSFRGVYRNRLWWVMGLTSGCYMILLLVGEPFLTLLIGYGGVTKANVQLLWWILLAMVGVLIGGGVGQILAGVFYAEGNTTTPTSVGVIGFTLGSALKVVGFLQLGLLGVAIGASLHQFFNTFLLYILLKRSSQKVNFFNSH